MFSSDLKKYIKQSINVAAGDYLTSIVSFIGQIYLIKLLTPVDFGRAAIIIATVEMLSIFLNLEFASVANYYQESKNKIAFIIKVSTIWRNFLTIMIILTLVLTSYISLQIDTYLIITLILMRINFSWVCTFYVLSERELDFTFQTWTRVFCRLTSITIAIILALNNFEYLSIIISEILFYGMLVFIFWLWKPKVEKNEGHETISISQLIKILFYQLLQRGSDTIAMRSPILLAAYLSIDLNIIGLFDRAIYLINSGYKFINPFITKVYFSYLKRRENISQKLIILSTSSVISISVTMFFSISIIVGWLPQGFEKWAILTDYINILIVFVCFHGASSILAQFMMRMKEIHVLSVIKVSILFTSILVFLIVKTYLPLYVKPAFILSSYTFFVVLSTWIFLIYHRGKLRDKFL